MPPPSGQYAGHNGDVRMNSILECAHRLVEALLLVQHLPKCLQDLNAQLLLFVHQFVCVLDQPAGGGPGAGGTSLALDQT